MSRSSVVDPFFDRVEDFMRQNNLLNQAARIYNIDETWLTPNVEKSQGVVTRKTNQMPYSVGGAQEHITLTMCICADGSFVPPMFTFKGGLSSSEEYHIQGPTDAIYTCWSH